MTDKEIIIDGKIIGCPCYIDRPLHRYHKGCLVQSQAFKEQQTEEKPILRCDEIKNCPIKENFKQLQCKTQECEKLEDFRTLTREVFTFGDSDVDDENFIKYLQEYSRSYEEAIDGYYRLTDITGIDYTVHGGADIEEIIKRVDILKQECEQIKEKYEALKLENQEGYEIVAELKHECEELKRKLSNQEQLYQNEIEIYNQSCLQLRQENDDLYLERLALNTANSGINALLEVKEQECDRYLKALEEIEKVCIEDTREFADGTQVRYDSLDEILEIINKAKGEGKCQ